MTNLIGQLVGHYHILEKLGEGGMAVVYKAYDTRLERPVAFKIILPQKQHTEKFIKRFDREAKALARLSHPNIVKVIDYGEHEGLPYLIMEYLQGGTLKKKLVGKPMPWPEAVRILIPIAQALGYAHAHKVIHRDIKPANILISEIGEPLVSDFGIAKILEADETLDLTDGGIGVGTPEYMSPEQAEGKVVDGRSDIYSLGVVFYEMVTGRKPYQADTPLAVIYKLASEPLPRPGQFVRDLDESVERVLLKMLAKTPQQRYHSFEELAQALENLLAGRETPSKRKISLFRGTKAQVFPLVALGSLVLAAISSLQVTKRLPFHFAGLPTVTVALPLPTLTSSSVTATSSVPTLISPTKTAFSISGTTNTYLTDFVPVDSKAEHDYLGYGVFPWSEGPMSKGAPIFVLGRYFEHAIFAHAKSSLKYDLGGKYQQLTTQVYYFGPCQPMVDGAIFRIFADNRLLYKSPALTYGDAAIPVDVELSGAKELLLTTDALSNASCDWTIWLDPILIPAHNEIKPTATVPLPSITSTPFTHTSEKDLTAQIVDSFPDKQLWITYSPAGNAIINTATDTDFVWATPVTIPVPDISSGRLALDLYLTRFGKSCKNELLFVFKSAEDFGTGDTYTGNANARSLQFVFLDNGMLYLDANVTKTMSLQSQSEVNLRLFISKNKQGDIEMEIYELSPFGLEYPGTFLDVITLPADWVNNNYSPNIGFDLGGGCRMELRGIVIRK